MHMSFYFINVIAEKVAADAFKCIALSVGGEENINILFSKYQVQ
jgi:hypothetical protein